MMKKAILIVLGLIFGISGYVGYNYFFTNTETLQSIHLVPRNAIYFVASDTPIENWKTIRDSEIWEHLQTNTYFADLTKSANTLDTILNENKKFFDLLGSKRVIVSAHPISKRDYDFLFIVDLKKTAKLLQLKNILKPMLSKDFSISERTYKKKEIIELFDKTTRETLYLSIINNNLVSSYTHTLVETAIDQITASTIGRDLKFIEINKHTQDNEMFRVFVQYDYLDDFAQIMTNTSNQWITDLSKNLVFSGFDMNLENGNKIIAEGYTNINDNSYSYLQAFTNAGVSPQKIANIAPHRTSMYFSLGFDDFNLFYENYKTLLEKDTKASTELEKNTKKIEDFLGISIKDNFINWIDDEIALLKLEPMSEGANTDFAVVLKAKSAKDANTNLDFILKRIKKKTPLKFKQIDYKGYPINFMSIKGFFKVFMGGYFKGLDKPYYTIIDDYVIFSNHPNTIKYIITNYKEKNILASASNYKKFKANFSSKSNVFIYLNTPMSYKSIINSTSGTTKKQLQKNKAYFTSFAQLGVQLFPEKGVFKSKFVIQYQDQESIIYSDEFKAPKVGPEPIPDDSPVFVDSEERELIETLEINPSDLNAKEYEEKYTNGELKVRAKLKDGLLDGRYREYYQNGEIKIKGFYKKGKRSGRWKEYDTEGKRVISIRY